MMTFDDVRRLALALPEVTEGLSYGTPAFRVRGALLARRHDDEDVLVVRVEAGQQEVLTQLEPETYFITPHYAGYPYVLVRIAQASESGLRGLLTDAWRLRAPRRLVKSFDDDAGANT